MLVDKKLWEDIQGELEASRIYVDRVRALALEHLEGLVEEVLDGAGEGTEDETETRRVSASPPSSGRLDQKHVNA